MLKIEDFAFVGHVTLTQVLRLDSEADAILLDDFLSLEGQDVLDSFRVAGPGDYLIHLNKGWDRSGDFCSLILRRVSYPTIPSPSEFLEKLADLKAVADAHAEPFRLARQYGVSAEALAAATPEERETIDRMDLDAYYESKRAVTRYMEGN